MSASHEIAVLPGDGIGPEIVDQALKVLRAFEKRRQVSFTLHQGLIGGAGIAASGQPLPDETLTLCQRVKVVLLGAVGDYQYDTLPPSERPEQGLLKLRKSLELFCNLRPVKAYDALLHTSTLKPEVVSGIDIMVVRELTGGLYFGQPRGREGDKAYDTMLYTVAEIERIAHVAFQLAEKRERRVTSVDKANVLASSQLWREVVTKVSEHYPHITLDHLYVDNASMQLIRNPKQFDVLLTENTFGDILSDEASMLTGSLGMLGSASTGSDGRAMYEPSHGSAPKYAGLDKVNPIATILSLGMMLDISFGYTEAPVWIDEAINAVLSLGYRTYDIAETDAKQVIGTSKMGDLIAEALLAPVTAR